MSGFWTVSRVADALAGLDAGAELPRGDEPLAGISTDTRAIQPGDCFVALVGERFDAHAFLGDAVAAGAAALVVERAPDLPVGAPTYVVRDTLVALGALSAHRRRAWKGTVVGVAGSNGKTSTKELLSAALEVRYEVHATRGNLNNRVGVPLTLLALRDDAQVAVVELGTNMPGEIATLRQIVRPDVTVVTSIAEEHLEGFGSLDGVMREEAASLDGVPLAVIPTGETALCALAPSLARRVITAGLDEGDVHAEGWSPQPDGTTLVTVDGVELHSPLRGVHNARNLMLAVAVARALDVPLADVASGLAGMTPPPMRANWTRVGDLLVINDAYNSNPGSARAAIAMLSAAPGSPKVAVLGTMRELGDSAARCHDEVAASALAEPLDVVAGIGDFAASLRRLAPDDPRVVTAADVDDLWPLLAPRLRPGASVLLKASRGVRLERVLPYLERWATAAC